MQNLPTVFSCSSEMSAADDEGAANCSQSTSHRCVQPIVIDARPSMLMMTRHRIVPGVTATPLVVIQHPLSQGVDCGARLQRAGAWQNVSQLAASTQPPKRKRRRMNKVSHEQFYVMFVILGHSFIPVE